MERGSTRRELIAATSMGALAASMIDGAAIATAAAGAGGEARALSNVLQIERMAVIAYSQALATPGLTKHVRAQLQLLLAQERKHVAKLEETLASLGAPAPQGPASVAAAQTILTQHHVNISLTNLSTQHDALRLLIDVESLSEGAYFEAIPQLDHPSLLPLAVEIMGSDSQHWTVLSGLQHGGDVSASVPYPFVQGST